ncbi:MAG: hypothetical protein AAF483_25325 [Planctomycetota bacterium]
MQCPRFTLGLVAEQRFSKLGWANGDWINRYFENPNGNTVLSRIEVYESFKHVKSIIPNNFSVFDEARVNELVDPSFRNLLENANRDKNRTRYE